MKNTFFIPGHLLNHSGRSFEGDELSWLLEQARAFDFKEVSLPPIDLSTALYDQVNKLVLKNQLKPVHYISSDEFSMNDSIADSLSEKINFIVQINKPLTTLFLKKLDLFNQYPEQIKFVLIARKDWNFIDTFKSIPHSIRENLYIDFPASLEDGDPFYQPNEVAGVCKQLKANFKDFKIKSHCPNLQFYSEYGGFQLKGYTGPRKLTSNRPKVSIVTTNPGLVSLLSQIDSVMKNPNDYEIIVSRFTGEKTTVVPQIKGLAIHKIWAHCEDVDALGLEDRFQLRNLAATYADGEFVVFCEDVESSAIKLLIDKVNHLSQDDQVILSGKNLCVHRQKFLDCGGYDILFSALHLGQVEFVYRYLKLLGKSWEPYIEQLRGSIKGTNNFYKTVGAKLFYSQHFQDDFYYKIFQVDEKTVLNFRQDTTEQPQLKLKYRIIRIKDAYFSLYKATPRVAIEGNLKFIWYFLLPYLKKIYAVLHRFYFDYIHKSYYFIYQVYYDYIHKSCYAVYQVYYDYIYQPYYDYVHRAYHGISYFIRYIYFNIIHRGYYKYVFRALYPVRKVYYILEYQYEKRVLGLHEKESQLKKAKT